MCLLVPSFQLVSRRIAELPSTGDKDLVVKQILPPTLRLVEAFRCSHWTAVRAGHQPRDFRRYNGCGGSTVRQPETQPTDAEV